LGDCPLKRLIVGGGKGGKGPKSREQITNTKNHEGAFGGEKPQNINARGHDGEAWKKSVFGKKSAKGQLALT